jgi:hypothetical protein
MKTVSVHEDHTVRFENVRLAEHSTFFKQFLSKEQQTGIPEDACLIVQLISTDRDDTGVPSMVRLGSARILLRTLFGSSASAIRATFFGQEKTQFGVVDVSIDRT